MGGLDGPYNSLFSYIGMLSVYVLLWSVTGKILRGRQAAEEAARRSPAADEVPAVDTTDVATFILISSVILSSFTIIGVSDLSAHIDWP